MALKTSSWEQRSHALPSGLGRSTVPFVGVWGVSQDVGISMLKPESWESGTRWSPCEGQISEEKQGSETHSQCVVVDQLPCRRKAALWLAVEADTQKQSSSLIGCSWLSEVSLLSALCCGYKWSNPIEDRLRKTEKEEQWEGVRRAVFTRQPAVGPGRGRGKMKRKKMWFYCGGPDEINGFVQAYRPQRGFPGASVVKNLPARQETWAPWIRKIPWRRKWQPAPVFLPGEFHGQRSLVRYSSWGCKESNITEWLNMHMRLRVRTHTHTIVRRPRGCFLTRIQ